MDNNEKIQLDDISIDDVLSGEGVETVSNESSDVAEKPVGDLTEETQVEEPETDEDIEEEEQEQEEEENLEDEEEDEDEDEEDEEYEDDDKDEVVSEEENPEDQTVVSEVLTKLGYEAEGDYEDSSEGLANMTADVASQMADEKIENVLQSFPLVRQHLEYVLAGGESKQFMKSNDPDLDYGDMKIGEEDVTTQKIVLGDYFVAKGHDEDFVKDMVNDLEDSGKLYDKAEAAREALSKVQNSYRERMLDEQKVDRQDKEKKLGEFWNGVADTIDQSKEFNGITVPDREKNEFFTYLSTPITREGYTQRDLDHAQADIDTKLAIDYLMYKGFNLDKLIDTKARTKNVRSLRDKIGRQEEYVKSARKTTRRSKNVNLDDLDLTI